MTTPKGTTLNYAKLRNQKRNNSNVDIEKDIDHLFPVQDAPQDGTYSGIQQFNGNGYMQNNNNTTPNGSNSIAQNLNKLQENQQYHQNSNNFGNGNRGSIYDQGNLKENQQQPSQAHHNSQNFNSIPQAQYNSLNQQQIKEISNRQNQSHSHHSQSLRHSSAANNSQHQSQERNDEDSNKGNAQKQQSQQYHQNQQKKNASQDPSYQSNQDYIEQMIKQSKQGSEVPKNKSKNVAAKQAIPSFMKGIHIMQQLQQQQQEQMLKAQKNKLLASNSQTDKQQQQNNDTVRINQKPTNSQQSINQTIQNKSDDTQQNDQPKQSEQGQTSNQEEKLTQRKTIGSSQPKLFDQFFRNNSYQASSNQGDNSPTPITAAQTQRNNISNQPEKVQNISVLSSNSEMKTSNNNSQVFTQPSQPHQQVQHSNHFNTSPSSHSNQPSSQSNNHQHQNHHFSSISSGHSNSIFNKRDSHTQIHLHQNQQSHNHNSNHQKKDSSLFNSQQSTILNNSIGNISPTAQFNNLDSSQFNISNISNIQNISNNVSSINNQSNIMINYNSNNLMNNSNANSTMSFQKQFEESSPVDDNEINQEKGNDDENQDEDDDDNNDVKDNNDFLNSLNAYIDYFGNPIYENEKSNKISQQQNVTNLELMKENQRLKSQLEQLEEKLKETETSRKILINDLSKIKNRDNEYKKKIQQLIKENSDTKAYVQSINYKLHHTQEQYAKEKIEHENTKFTLKKALQGRSTNAENFNFSNNKVDSLIRPQKINNQPQRKTYSQQFTNSDNRNQQSNNKLGMNSIPMQQYQKAYPNAYQNLIDSASNFQNGKQPSYPIMGSHMFTNSNNTATPQSNLMVNQQQIYDGEQSAISRIMDQDEKIMDQIQFNQNQAAYSNQLILTPQGQELPMMMERYNEPAFGGGIQKNQLNEYEELECKDFNLDDSNQNLEGMGGNDMYQDNAQMGLREDYTDNTTDIINLNQPSPSIPIYSGVTASTGGGRSNSLHHQKYINTPIYQGGTTISSNNQIGYKQQLGNIVQDDDYEVEEDEDMDLSDNFNLDTDNQINDDIAMINIENQNKGLGTYDGLAPQIQSDGVTQDKQYYEFQNKIFNTYDNNNFKYGTHRDFIDQNQKNISPYAATSYKKGAGSLDEDHIYQMMKLQYHPNSIEMNRLNLNLKATNQNSIPNATIQKSQLKKQQIIPSNRSSQGVRTMSLSYQKPQFSAQSIQQVQLMQNQKQKFNLQQQQLLQLQQQQQQQVPYANYQ